MMSLSAEPAPCSRRTSDKERKEGGRGGGREGEGVCLEVIGWMASWGWGGQCGRDAR